MNGVYFTVRESGAFQITYTFTNNIPAIQNSINFTGRYQGNTTHNVELQIWNYSISAWDNVRAATKYFPLSTTDYNISFAIPGTLANYYTGTAPNLTARIKVNHTSGAITTHYFYTDMISLSKMADLSLTKTVSSTPPIVGNLAASGSATLNMTARVNTGTSGRTLAVSSLSMPQPTVAADGTSSGVPTITAVPYIIDSGSAVKIASAAADNGMGVYNFTQNPAGLTLSIPANAYAASCRSEVTVSIVSGAISCPTMLSWERGYR